MNLPSQASGLMWQLRGLYYSSQGSPTQWATSEGEVGGIRESVWGGDGQTPGPPGGNLNPKWSLPRDK